MDAIFAMDLTPSDIIDTWKGTDLEGTVISTYQRLQKFEDESSIAKASLEEAMEPPIVLEKKGSFTHLKVKEYLTIEIHEGKYDVPLYHKGSRDKAFEFFERKREQLRSRISEMHSVFLLGDEATEISRISQEASQKANSLQNVDSLDKTIIKSVLCGILMENLLLTTMDAVVPRLENVPVEVDQFSNGLTIAETDEVRDLLQTGDKGNTNVCLSCKTSVAIDMVVYHRQCKTVQWLEKYCDFVYDKQLGALCAQKTMRISSFQILTLLTKN
ncbi:unnamed protein product [Bemisia tabaci]|uniref:Uncharacterized protein n=1 Tax=Bemisia tabaci TaxID=7038 RepID=A0A9P0AKQ0_BEMTA|nr:unnamed protein product [Bemisia tabaci]